MLIRRAAFLFVIMFLLAACGGEDFEPVPRSRAPAETETDDAGDAVPDVPLETLEVEIVEEPEPEPEIIPATPVEPEDLTPRGNTTGNSVNHGIAAFDGDWIYYFNDNHSRHLYKIRNDGTEKTLISDEISGAGINVLDGWIYYLGFEEVNTYITPVAPDGFWLLVMEYRGIFKCRTDGTEITLLSEESAENLTVVGDWIYYISGVHEHEYIYKMRLDGTENTQLNNEISRSMNVVGDWIYYTGHYMGERVLDHGIYTVPMLNGIFKIRTDGTERTPIIMYDGMFDHIYNIVVSGGWIYYNFVHYTNEQHHYERYKIRTDSSGKTLLQNEAIHVFGVEEDRIYFSTWNVIGKMRTDGTDEIIFTEDASMLGALNKVGDWIYFRSGGPWGLYDTYRININGGEIELIE